MNLAHASKASPWNTTQQYGKEQTNDTWNKLDKFPENCEWKRQSLKDIYYISLIEHS